MILGQVTNFSEPQIPNLQNGNTNSPQPHSVERIENHTAYMYFTQSLAQMTKIMLANIIDLFPPLKCKAFKVKVL